MSGPVVVEERQNEQLHFLRKLKHSFEHANLVLEKIMEVKSTYNNLYFQRHEFWESLMALADLVAASIGSTLKPTLRSSTTPKRLKRICKRNQNKNYTPCILYIRRAKKIMKTATNLCKEFASVSQALRSAYQRLEDISQNYWERQAALDSLHRRLDIMTREEMETAIMPDFDWVLNNLYPDHIHLKEEWENLKLLKALKELQLEFKALQKTDFSKVNSNDESSSESESTEEENEEGDM